MNEGNYIHTITFILNNETYLNPILLKLDLSVVLQSPHGFMATTKQSIEN